MGRKDNIRGRKRNDNRSQRDDCEERNEKNGKCEFARRLMYGKSIHAIKLTTTNC